MTRYTLQVSIPFATMPEADRTAAALTAKLAELGYTEFDTCFFEATRDHGPVIEGWLLIEADTLTDASARIDGAFGEGWRRATGGTSPKAGILTLDPATR